MPPNPTIGRAVARCTITNFMNSLIVDLRVWCSLACKRCTTAGRRNAGSCPEFLTRRHRFLVVGTCFLKEKRLLPSDRNHHRCFSSGNLGGSSYMCRKSSGAHPFMLAFLWSSGNCHVSDKRVKTSSPYCNCLHFLIVRQFQIIQTYQTRTFLPVKSRLWTSGAAVVLGCNPEGHHCMPQARWNTGWLHSQQTSFTTQNLSINGKVLLEL